MSELGTLSIRNVSKQYKVKGSTLSVLENIDLDVKPGEFVAIVGSSGCGKSTLLRLVVGLEGDYRGDILLDGERITGPGLQRGIVFQEHRLFPWATVRENVGLGLLNADLERAEKERLIQEHIDLVGLHGFENAHPHQLSGGMAQRAAIARGLVNRPEILLLDEPFGALDALTKIYLQTELQRIWLQEDITMILVTHDVEEAVFLSDRVVVMDARPGRIKRIVPVPLEHPRDRADPEFARLKNEVLGEISGFKPVNAKPALKVVGGGLGVF
ncbi:ABC transporter ATP-binding protein [Methylococcus mesophilus]|uniref:ABC transporter ATP-binding protein n=1 Tax=Methylococcus mesophilus TaxID=2993564 RepID=UPI00224B80ED|nr:ABC transporter ATP-binding protein [Methylococcus mesophilus]UZR29581.1 ABC transporter ATP-binding protein [Methylococcus mesophilus]